MGGNSSKTIIDDVTTIINKSVNKTNNDINNSAECKSNIDQKIVVSTGNDMITEGNCKVTLGQKSEAKVKCMVDSVQTSATDISNDISEDLKSYSDRTIEQEVEGVPMGSSKDDYKKKSRNYISNHLENIIENNIKNTLKSSTKEDNTIEVIVGNNFICKDNGEFDISQEGLLESISIASATQLVNGIIDTELKIKKDDKLKEKKKQVNKGLTLAGSMGSLLAIALLIGCSLSAYLFMNPETQQQSMAALQNFTYRQPPVARGAQGGAKLLFSKYGLYLIIIILLFINFYF